jgi:hypothetical protein
MRTHTLTVLLPVLVLTMAGCSAKDGGADGASGSAGAGLTSAGGGSSGGTGGGATGGSGGATGGGGTTGGGGGTTGGSGGAPAGGSGGTTGGSGGASGASGSGGSSGTGTGGTAAAAPIQLDGDVTLTDSTWDFRHTDYTLASNGSLATNDHGNVVTTTYDVKIIENDLVRVTVLPGLGGRILSIIYKPTNHELLYQNSVGVAYGQGAGNFYYDWLMIVGGIFPTFPEAEHGKMWYLPWDYEVVTESADEVAVRMSIVDDIAPQGGVPPEKFPYGRTDLVVTNTVRVRRGSAAVQLDLALENTRADSFNYEYWTCTTLAPGSTPGASGAPLNTEIAAPIEEITFPSFYGWVGGVEQSVGNGAYRFENLRYFSGWPQEGIIYAHPRMNEDYWGVINHENEVGVFRVADCNVTPGLKFWTWGRNSVNVDPNSVSDARPFIELWGGHSLQFFSPAQISPNQTIAWTERYFATVGLSEITTVNESAATHLSYSSQGDSTEFVAELFAAEPSMEMNVTLFVQSGGEQVLLEQAWVPDPTQATRFAVSVPNGDVSGANQFGIRLETAAGAELLTAAIDYSP